MELLASCAQFFQYLHLAVSRITRLIKALLLPSTTPNLYLYVYEAQIPSLLSSKVLPVAVASTYIAWRFLLTQVSFNDLECLPYYWRYITFGRKRGALLSIDVWFPRFAFICTSSKVVWFKGMIVFSSYSHTLLLL